MHIPVCARVGLNSKVKKKGIYGNAQGKTKRNHGLGKGFCRAHANRIIAMSDKMTIKKVRRRGKKKKKKKKSAVDGSVRRPPIQVLTGFALLNFTEKTRALCFHPTRTDMQND